MSGIVFNAPTLPGDLQSQVENLQTSLASLNEQVIILQEAVQERDQKIAELQKQLADASLIVAGSQVRSDESETRRASPGEPKEKRTDETLTILGALVKLYRLIFPPGKAE